ncbi:MAG: hypothetical protein IJ164_00240 [Duodenibacillus sp.]|nr:hypothetical protein [Duodenibacillus sp.]
MGSSRLTAAALAALIVTMGQPQAASIYDQKGPSIYDEPQGGRGVVAKRERETGATRLIGEAKEVAKALNLERKPLINDKGEFVGDIRVRIDGPSRFKDEEGNTLSISTVYEREQRRKQVFEILKSQGYSWKERQKEIAEEKAKRAPGHEKVPSDWYAENEAMRQYIEKNGPITSKHFVRPGTTPEMSDAMDQAYAYRRVGGKWVVVDRSGNPIANRFAKEKEEVKPVRGEALTTVITTVKKRPARSSDEAYIAAETYWKDNPAYTKEVTPELVERIAQGRLIYKDPRLANKDVQALFPALEKAPDGTIRRIQEIRLSQPDEEIVRARQKKAEQEGKPDPTKGILDKLFKPQGKSGQPKGKPVSLHSLSGKVLSAVFGVSAAKAAEGFASEDGREYRPEKLPEWQKDFKEQMQFPENVHMKENAGRYESIANDIAKQTREIERKALEASSNNGEPEAYIERLFDEAQKKAEQGDANAAHAQIAAEAAQYAADIVHITGSLSTQEFDEDVNTIVSLLNKDNGEIFIGELEKILRAYPELYDLNPTAGQDLAELAADRFGIGEEPDNPMGSTTFIFVSRSLDNDLYGIVERAAQTGRKDLVLVFRGVPEGKSINEGVLDLSNLSKIEPAPTIIIDPTLFKVYDVKNVPTVVRAKRYKRQIIPGQKATTRGEMIAKVAGLDNDAWLMEQIESGQTGDMGLRGDVREISEPDLIEVMKERAARIDWEAKRQAAIKNAWKHQKFIELPTATESRIRRHDPTIVVKEDLKDIAGNLIRKTGDRVNPLAIRPFGMQLLVFNPLKKDELERVDRFLSRNRLAGRPYPVLIATQVNKASGWDSYKELTDHFDRHVYILTSDVQESFDIRATPSVVSADHQALEFLIEELGPIEAQGQQ